MEDSKNFHGFEWSCHELDTHGDRNIHDLKILRKFLYLKKTLRNSRKAYT